MSSAQPVAKPVKKLIHKTPLLFSHPLSQMLNKRIYLKMDALQPSGSFKDRGMSYLLRYYVSKGIRSFVSASGGNAGLSVATVANIMNLECQVVVPTTTNKLAMDKIRSQGAILTVHGDNLEEAIDHAKKEVMNSNGKKGFVHPFQNPISWNGHMTVIDEIKEQWDHVSYSPPDAIICSVGGGGLLNGICMGLDKYFWTDHTTVITSETIGCDSLYQSYIQNKIITLPSIDSIAKPLGAREVAKECLEYLSQRPHICDTVTDKESVMAVKSFLNDHRILVEPACGAALALLYQKKESISRFNYIIVEVCGGSGIDVHILEEYMDMFGIEY